MLQICYMLLHFDCRARQRRLGSKIRTSELNLNYEFSLCPNMSHTIDGPPLGCLGDHSPGVKKRKHSSILERPSIPAPVVAHFNMLLESTFIFISPDLSASFAVTHFAFIILFTLKPLAPLITQSPFHFRLKLH